MPEVNRVAALTPPREHPWDYPTMDDYEIVSIRGYPLVHYDYQISYKGRRYWYYDPRMTRVKVRDWDAFRDPARLYYRAYVRNRNELWTRATQVLDAINVLDMFARTNDAWVAHLSVFYPAFRHLQAALSLQLVHATRFVLGAPLQQAAAFAAYDRTTFSQLITQYLLLLERRRAGVLSEGQAQWMTHPALQPLRRTAEQLLATDDPVEVLFATCAVFGPLVDRWLCEHLSRLSLENGDFVNAQLLKALEPQTRWAFEIGKTLVDFLQQQQATSRWDYLKAWGHFTKDYRFGTLVEDPMAEPEEPLSNREILAQWFATWHERTAEALAALAPFINEAPARHTTADAVLGALRDWYLEEMAAVDLPGLR
jgi:phenol hydroxylase P1 protein